MAPVRSSLKSGAATMAAQQAEEKPPRPSPSKRVFAVAVIAVFFALVMLAPLPMGANRDWAWSPIAVGLGLVAILVAAGVGVGDGHGIRRAELWPLLWLILCFLLVIAVGCLQMASFAPAGGSAWFYAAASAALERPIAAIPSLSADATRDKLLKIAACGAVFVRARYADWLVPSLPNARSGCRLRYQRLCPASRPAGCIALHRAPPAARFAVGLEQSHAEF
jgi:hypothetical protein